jgi:multicomponent Na+:H+ antiporter subunit D
MWASAGHYDLRRIGGLYPLYPLLAGVFLLHAFSLVGVPPSSGFWGKYGLIAESFRQERFVWGGAALATGFLTLYSMSKIWLEAFWKPRPDGVSTAPSSRIANIPWSAWAAVVGLSFFVLYIGVYPEPLIHFLELHTQHFFGSLR